MLNSGIINKATISKFTCEKGEQMFRVGCSGWVDKLYINNIAHGKLYIDDVLIQDIVGNTTIDIKNINQFIYKKIRVDRQPAGAMNKLDIIHKKLMNINNVDIDVVMSSSIYDKRFNSLNSAKCNIYIYVHTSHDINLHYYHFDDLFCTDNVEIPRVNYTIYNPPIGMVSQLNKHIIETNPIYEEPKAIKTNRLCCLIL